MKKYQAPRLDIYEVSTEDIVRTSSPYGYLDANDTDEFGNLLGDSTGLIGG